VGAWIDTLRRSRPALIVDVPVQMDDGRIIHFEGYRVHHNTSRGLGKGGVRVQTRAPDRVALKTIGRFRGDAMMGWW
jgi:glutamate dehydrogenase/leucine dehydrogenase